MKRKVAVITGASQGIGAALVEAHRTRGYRVIATARSMPQAEDPEVLAIAGDIADPEMVERVISFRAHRLARQQRRHFHRQTIQRTHRGRLCRDDRCQSQRFFHITQRAIAEMEKNGSGHVVQITTSLVDHANSQVPSVLASLTRGGLNAATKSLAIEYAKRGIRLNAAAPGVIKTPMHPAESVSTQPPRSPSW
jgi:NAD(P)-dependent dehydrogenase (short-subunit alcohol dehydrogenase family)